MTDERDRKERAREFEPRWVATVEPDEGKEEIEFADTKLRGLKLRVWKTEKGEIRRGWSVTYTAKVTGKRRRYVLGQFPAVSLADARKRGGEILGDVAARRDPFGEERARAEEEHRKAEAGNVSALLDRWLDEDGVNWKPGVRKEWGAMAGRWKSEIGKLEIESPEIRRRVQGYILQVAKTKPTAANRRFEVIRRCFRWAVARGILAASPLAGMEKPTKEKARERVYADAELRAIHEIATGEGWAGLFLLVAFTGVRLSEALRAERKEFDIDRSLWTVPGARTKTGDPHLVPLSAGVLRVLAEIRAANLAAGWGGAGFLFPTRSRKGAVVPRVEPRYKAVKVALCETGRLHVLHDVRRTVRSRLPGLGVTPDVCERVLGHALGGIRSVYDKYDYVPRVREALDLWSAECSKILRLKPPADEEKRKQA